MSKVEILNVEKIYDVEYTCPHCGDVAEDRLIGCTKAKCHCNHIVEFDEFELEDKC